MSSKKTATPHFFAALKARCGGNDAGAERGFVPLCEEDWGRSPHGNERKLEYFAETIAREVENKKHRAKHQLANDLSTKAAALFKEAEGKIILREQAVKKNLEKKMNREISKIEGEERRKFNKKREALQAKLLKEVEAELILFTRSGEYENYLIERISLVKSDFHMVKLNAEDMKFAETIQKATGLIVQRNEKENCIGGFILQTENGKIQADYTFETALKGVDII